MIFIGEDRKMLYPSNLNLMAKSLDWAAERQKILAHNIANADTPGYKRMELEFPQELKKRMELKKTHPRHMSGAVNGRSVSWFDRGAVRVDDNNVDVEVEEVRLAENAMYFQSVTEELNRSFKRLRTAIQGK